MRPPRVLAAATREAALAEQVLAWRAEGIEPHVIGVAARSGYLGKQAEDALAAAGVPRVNSA